MNDDKNSLNHGKRKTSHQFNNTSKNNNDSSNINASHLHPQQHVTNQQKLVVETNIHSANSHQFPGTDGHFIQDQSRIIDTATYNNNNTNRVPSQSTSLSSISGTRKEGIFSQNNVDTMMNNILQQILSTLSTQQERMNTIQQQLQDQQNLNKNTIATDDNNFNQDETCNAYQQQASSSMLASFSSPNNDSGDILQKSLGSSSRTTSSSSNNVTTNSTTSNSTSSSSFLNDSKKFTLSSGTTTSTLEFINRYNNLPSSSSSSASSTPIQQQQHIHHNDQISEGGISQLFEECAHSTFNIDPSPSHAFQKSSSEVNFDDYQDLFSDTKSVRESEPTITQHETDIHNNKQTNTMVESVDESMLWGMLRQMLGSTECELTEDAINQNDYNSGNTQSNLQQQADLCSNQMGNSNFQQYQIPQPNQNITQQFINTNNSNNVRQLISTLHGNLNSGRQMHPALKMTTLIPDFKNELDLDLPHKPTLDSTKLILGSIQKTLSNKLNNNTPNQYSHKYTGGVQQKPSNGFIKWLSNQQNSHSDGESEQEQTHQPISTSTSSGGSSTPNKYDTSSEKNTPTSDISNPQTKPLKIFQHNPHKTKKKKELKDLQNGEHLITFQSPQSENSATLSESPEKKKRKQSKRKEDKSNKSTKKSKKRKE